ncbi:hypothetical protein LXL04_009106 [Taraxacum kok-saghyz]
MDQILRTMNTEITVAIVGGTSTFVVAFWLLSQRQLQPKPTWWSARSDKTMMIAVEKEGGDVFNCIVCFCEVSQEDEYKKLPNCNHGVQFHAHCIDAWLKNHSNCPMCRSHIPCPLSQRLKAYVFQYLVEEVISYWFLSKNSFFIAPLLWLGHESHATTGAAHVAAAPSSSLLAPCCQIQLKPALDSDTILRCVTCIRHRPGNLEKYYIPSGLTPTTTSLSQSWALICKSLMLLPRICMMSSFYLYSGCFISIMTPYVISKSKLNVQISYRLFYGLKIGS